MTAPIKLNLKIYQGSTFKEVLRWESSTKIYAAITGITKSAPVVITAVSHGIPVGWRTKITNVGGMKELNSVDTYHTVTTSTINSVTINAINALGYTDYTTGGVLEYNQPVDLAGMTARMHIRDKITSETPLLTLTTENSRIIIDNTLKTITLTISATDTAALTFTSGIYSLELQNSLGEVFPFINGTISVVQEVTR